MNDPGGQPLPDLHTAMLSAEMLGQLLADLRDHAEVLSVQARGAARGAAQAAGLEDVVRLLDVGPGASVQISYRHGGELWIDTLMAGDDGTKLVRMRRG